MRDVAAWFVDRATPYIVLGFAPGLTLASSVLFFVLPEAGYSLMGMVLVTWLTMMEIRTGLAIEVSANASRVTDFSATHRCIPEELKILAERPLRESATRRFMDTGPHARQ